MGTEETPQYDAETERALRLYVVLSRCFHSVTEHGRRDIVGHNLSVSEFGVLELLYHKGPQPLGVLAKRVLLTTGSITYVVDQLEKQELVRRVSCPKDRRRLYAELTDAGRALLQRIFPLHCKALLTAVAGLSAEEQETVTGLLKRLGTRAEQALLPAKPAEKTQKKEI